MSDLKFKREPLLSPSTREHLKTGASVAAIIFGVIATGVDFDDESKTPKEQRQDIARHYENNGCETHEFVENGGLITCPDDSLDNE